MWGYHESMGWGWWAFGMIWMVAFWGAMIALVLWGFNRVTGVKRDRRDQDEAPTDIARRRLALGEITRE